MMVETMPMTLVSERIRVMHPTNVPLPATYHLRIGLAFAPMLREIDMRSTKDIIQGLKDIKHKVEGRAQTFEEKRLVIMRLLHAWKFGAYDTRLGQLIVNALGKKDLFNIEDEELIKTIEAYIKEYHQSGAV
jgi:hypothetical protein